MIIKQPNQSYFKQIKQLIAEFELDDRNLKKDEFLIIEKNHKLIAFGRIRKHKANDELCSLGVVADERKKGYAKLLIKELIKTSNQPLFLVCIIPELFTPFNFITADNFPIEALEKLNYCTKELVVKEKYVVMMYFESSKKTKSS